MQDFLRRTRGVAKVVRQVVEKFLYAGGRFQCAQGAQLRWCEIKTVTVSHGFYFCSLTRLKVPSPCELRFSTTCCVALPSGPIVKVMPLLPTAFSPKVS